MPVYSPSSSPCLQLTWCWRGVKTLNADVFVPPTFSRLEVADHAPLVDAYTTNGFILRGGRVLGSVALLPRGYFHWRVGHFDDLTPESFTLFHLVQPKLGA